jgi:hypothetical protein
LASLAWVCRCDRTPCGLLFIGYFGAAKNDINLGLRLRLQNATHIDLKTTAFDSFIATRSRFLVYEGWNGDNLAANQAVAKAGYRLISARGDSAGIMYEYEKP